MTGPSSAHVGDLGPREAAAILAELRRLGFTVTLGANAFDLVTCPSLLEVPDALFEYLVAAQDAVRELLHGRAAREHAA